MSSGWIFDIKRFAIHDGPGIRTTVFMKGCPLNCTWCHNPESRDMEPVKTIRERKLDDIIFREEEIIGREYSVEQLLEEIMKDVVYFRESGGGVTFSGGEPLMQPVFLKEILIKCKENGLHTCVDTCGYAERKIIRDIAEHTDVFLYDLKLIDEETHIKYTGVSNHLILDNLRWLHQNDKQVVVRVPVIPGITSTESNISAIRQLLFETGIKRLDLIPYHDISRAKYRKLGLPYYEIGNDGLDMENIRKLFIADGFQVELS